VAKAGSRCGPGTRNAGAVLEVISGCAFSGGMPLAGIRYAFIGKTMEPRASYRVLGTLLFTQLAITASLGAIDALAQSLTPQTQRPDEGTYGNKDGHAVLMQVCDVQYCTPTCALVDAGIIALPQLVCGVQRPRYWTHCRRTTRSSRKLRGMSAVRQHRRCNSISSSQRAMCRPASAARCACQCGSTPHLRRAATCSAGAVSRSGATRSQSARCAAVRC
jgi:hypothetical protein